MEIKIAFLLKLKKSIETCAAKLKQIKTDMDKLDKQKKKLFGADLITNLNKQLKLLDKQIDTTNDKLKIAEGEQDELKKKLGDNGVIFNSDGTIANYAQAYASQLNYVNSIIAKYNTMSAEAQESYKDTVEKAKEDFDKFVENLERYDEVVTDLIPGLEADIQDAIDEKIDLQIEKLGAAATNTNKTQVANGNIPKYILQELIIIPAYIHGYINIPETTNIII